MLVDPARLPRLAVPFMNADHAEEARLINVVADAVEALRTGKGDAGQVRSALDGLYVHTRAHFGREESAMAAASFPASSNHQAEHARILGELDEAERQFRETGQGEPLAAYLAAFPTWFEQHIASMDAVTARYLAEWGG